MSTIQASNLKNAASASNNIVLDASGNATFAGTAAMASSFLRNRIINGSFDVWQRGTSFSSVSFGTYGADRWLAGANTVTFTRSTDVPSGFQYSLSVAQASVDFATAMQRIESVNCYDLVGQQVTVSFWAKSIAGTQNLTVSLDRANAADNFSSTTRLQDVQVSANPSTSWTRYTATFNALPSQAANGIQVLIYRNTGAASTTLYTGVQLEVGTVATPFERRLYGQELSLCQRYYYTIRATDNNLTNFGVGAGQGSNFCLAVAQLSPIMRASPTFSSSAANTFQISSTAASSVIGDILSPWTATWGVQVTGVANAGAYRIVANSTTSAFIALSAEL